MFQFLFKKVTRLVQEAYPVFKQVGPDKLNMGLEGSLLNFWESKLNMNFGSGLLDFLGIEAPSISRMKNGGMVSGLSHGMGGVLAELEGGEYVMNRESVEDTGLGFMNGLNSGGRSFTDKLVSNSSMNNQLLSRLIEVVEEKEMSVTVVNDERNTGDGRDIRMSREREMSYRGARNIA